MGIFDDLDTDPLTAPAEAKAEMRQNAHMANGGESLRVTCPACRGTGRWGRERACFTCEGTGKATPRKAGAVKAKHTKRTNQEKWISENQDLMKVLHAEQGWNSFFAGLVLQIATGRILSDKQIAAVWSSMAKVEASREAKRAEREAAQAAAAVPVSAGAVKALFEKARESGLKKPQFVAGAVRLKQAPDSGKNAGAIYVTQNGDYAGKIMGGRFHATQVATEETHKIVQELSVDPRETAVRYGRSTGTCCLCGKTLTDPTSVANGIGPICEGKWF